MFFIETV